MHDQLLMILTGVAAAIAVGVVIGATVVLTGR